MSWTDERVEILRQLWLKGSSATQISAALGGGISSDAVIGKVHRLGLTRRARTSSPASTPSAQSSDDGRVTHTRTVTGKIVTAADAHDTAANPAVTAQRDNSSEPLPLRVTRVELTETMCRWELGDPARGEFRYCGARTRGNSPYCSYHRKLAPQKRRDERERERRHLQGEGWELPTDEIVAEAFGAVAIPDRDIEGSSAITARVHALSDFIPHLPDAERELVLREAFAGAITPSDYYALAQAIARLLPDAERKSVLREAFASPRDSFDAFTTASDIAQVLAPLVPPEEKLGSKPPAYLQNAFIEAVAELIMRLPEAEMRNALTVLSKIRGDSSEMPPLPSPRNLSQKVNFPPMTIIIRLNIVQYGRIFTRICHQNELATRL